MVGLILTIFVMAGSWRMFQKMGQPGWAAIVPFYNTYVVCETLYGSGWKMLLFLIPLYNIYYGFRVGIDLARGFNQGTGYGIGLTLLSVVFVPLTGFGSAVWGDGTQAAWSDDVISRTLDDISDKMNGTGPAAGEQEHRASQEREDREVLRMLRELEELRQAGVLTDEEFAAKKAVLLNKI